MKAMVDELYWKEKKYVRQYMPEDYLGKNDFIFDLKKTHKLKLAKGEEKSALQASAELMISGNN